MKIKLEQRRQAMLQLHLSDQHAVGAAPTGDAPTTSEWSTIILPTEVWLILEVWRYTILHSTFCNWRINFYAQCINYLKTSATSSRKQPKTLVIIVVRMLYGTVFRCFQTSLLCNESFYTNHWKFQTHTISEVEINDTKDFPHKIHTSFFSN